MCIIRQPVKCFTKNITVCEFFTNFSEIFSQIVKDSVKFSVKKFYQFYVHIVVELFLHAFLHLRSGGKILVQVHFTIASQYYVNVNVEFYVHVFLHFIRWRKTGMLSSINNDNVNIIFERSEKRRDECRAIILARGE